MGEVIYLDAERAKRRPPTPAPFEFAGMSGTVTSGALTASVTMGQGIARALVEEARRPHPFLDRLFKPTDDG